MRDPKRSAGFLSTNRRSFTTTSNANAQRHDTRKARSGWNNEANENYGASNRNDRIDRSSSSQYGSKTSGFNRFLSNKEDRPSERSDSLPLGHHSEFGSSLATRRFESKKLKNDREFASNSAVPPSAPPVSAAAPNAQSEMAPSAHRFFENSTSNNQGEYLDDFDAMIPSSPYGSEMMDENMWLDVVPGAEFEFSTDLEASKVDYNNEIDDLNAEQLESDLTVLERSLQDDTPSKNVNSVDLSKEPQREVVPLAEENQKTKFDLDEFFSKQLPMKQPEPSMFPEHGGMPQQSRLQRLYKSNDEHKQMGAEFDRYLQSFEFDPETNDLRRFIEPNSTRPDLPRNAMSLMTEKTFLPVNAPMPQPQPQQQPSSQPTQRSRFAHIFNSDFNQNTIHQMHEQSKMDPLTIKPVQENTAAVFSVADLEADISPVAPTNNASFVNTNMNPQGMSHPFDMRLMQERKNIISANELEKDMAASTSPDNDLSAFTSLLDKMGAQKVQSGMHMSSSQTNSRPPIPTNSTAAPRIYSPGPDIIHTSVGMDSHFMNERTLDGMNAAKKMTGSTRPESNLRQAEPVNHRSHLFSQVAKQNGDGGSMNKTQHQQPMVSGVPGVDPRNISPIPTPMGQNMNMNVLMQNLQQKAALNNNPSSVATSQNLLNLPPNLIIFQQQLALQQQQQQQKLKQQQQQQQSKAGGIPQNVLAVNASKRQGGNQDMFTPTAVMRNLSLENPPNSFNSGSISSASSQQPTFSNSSQKPMSNIANHSNQPFSGNALQQTNQLLLQNALMNNLKIGSTTSTQALRTQISAGIQGVPNVVNAVSSANQSSGKMVSSAGQTSGDFGNLMTSSSVASSTQCNSSNIPVSNVTPVMGAPLINPFLLGPLMRAAPPNVVLPTPNNSLNMQQLQQMIIRQQLAASNVLLRAQLMRQLNATGAAIPNNNNNNNNIPGTAPTVGGGSRNMNLSQPTLPLSTATIDSLLASGDSLFSNTINGPNSSMNPGSLGGSQLNKTVGGPTQVQDMQNMKLPPGLNVKDNMGPS